MAAAKKHPSPPPSVHIGDHVRFNWGGDEAEGVVVEDRGPLGIGGRRLYDIAFKIDIDSEEWRIELPACEFVVVQPARDSTDKTGIER